MSRLAINRRRFLSAVGASAVSLPFLRSLPGYAAASDQRYLILIFSPNGVIRHRWGADAAPDGTLTLRDSLAPLEAFKDRMAIVTGLANKVSGEGDPHGPGMASLWTGVTTANQDFAAGISIDQAIGDAISAPTPHKSIEFRARSPQDFEGKDVHNRMIYAGPGQPIDPREDPVAARDQLFLGIPMGGDDPPVDPRLEVRRKLFARLTGEIDTLRPKLCADDQLHLDALRDGWDVLNSRLAGGGQALAECEYPVITQGPQFPDITRDHIELLAMSMACDLTRIASLQFSQALSPMIPSFLNAGGMAITEDHHNISHKAPMRHEFPLVCGPNNTNCYPDADSANIPPEMDARMDVQQMVEIQRFYAAEVAYLCERLNQFPVAGGGTLLDRVTICWGNELDNGAGHDKWDMPFVLIGGGAGRLRTNQIVQFPRYYDWGESGPITTAERAHNDLLVTLAQLMGATNITSFGEPSANVGPISELLI